MDTPRPCIFHVINTCLVPAPACLLGGCSLRQDCTGQHTHAQTPCDNSPPLTMHGQRDARQVAGLQRCCMRQTSPAVLAPSSHRRRQRSDAPDLHLAALVQAVRQRRVGRRRLPRRRRQALGRRAHVQLRIRPPRGPLGQAARVHAHHSPAAAARPASGRAGGGGRGRAGGGAGRGGGVGRGGRQRHAAREGREAGRQEQQVGRGRQRQRGRGQRRVQQRAWRRRVQRVVAARARRPRVNTNRTLSQV